MLSGGGRRGMGGGGGGMLMKTFQRAVRAGVGGSNTNIGGVKAAEKAGFNRKRPTSPNTALILSPYSSPYSPRINSDESDSAPYFWLKNTPTDESEWECVDGIEDETAARGFHDNYVFGTVPSRDEVQHAVFVLQQVAAKEKVGEALRGDSEEDIGNAVHDDDEKIPLDRDWDEPSHSLYTSRMLQYSRSSDIAFHLLETDPSVQRMVVSLSSDQAVWDAVMNNEVVKELRESIHGVSGESLDEGSDEDGSDENILEWIVIFAKAKIMQVWEKMRELMNPNQEEENERRRAGDGTLNEIVKTSFFLSMVVMIVVVLARAKNNTG